MKKLLLFSAAIAMSFSSFAQGVSKKGLNREGLNTVVAEFGTAQKSTADGDTIFGRLNFPAVQLDSMILYYGDATPFDTGFAYGSNAYGDKGFAERYDLNGADSGVYVIGCYAFFGGTVNPATNKSINFNVWAAANKSAATNFGPTWYYSGLPAAGTYIAPQTVSIKNLGIGNANPDTMKLHMFSTNSGLIADSFFLGYTMNYTWANMAGDTIGLYTTRDGYRYSNGGWTVGTDTIMNVKNAVQYSDNSWHDANFENFQQFLHLGIFPVMVINYLSVKGISKNNFTLFGNYPNPATNSTTVKYGVKAATMVTVTITDMTGRIVNTINEGTVSAGEHTVSINTSDLAAGNYIYLVRTGEGDGMAARFTVIK
jgi:hypothetical protein